MKTKNIIILSILYSIILSVINIYALTASHEFYYIILPFLVDPITHLILYMGWIKNNELLESFIFIPIFWPIATYILIKIKNKYSYILLGIIYLFIIIISSYRLINEIGIINKTINSLAIYIEPIGIILFILGQIGIFYILHDNKKIIKYLI